MEMSSSSQEATYQLPSWFLKRNITTAAKLADIPNQIVFCASDCHYCQDAKADDQFPNDEESSEEPCSNKLHYKEFVELRDTIFAALLHDQNGRVIQAENFGVVSRMEYGDQHIMEPAWMYQAGVQLAKEVGATLITLDYEDMEELGCAFHHQEQERRNKEETDVVSMAGTEATDVGDTAESEDEANSQEEDWKPDGDSFTTFLDRYFAVRTKRKTTTASVERGQQAISAILDAVDSSPGAASPEKIETSTTPGPRPILLYIIDCEHLSDELHGRTKRRILARCAEVLQARREEGQAVAMLVSTKDYDLQHGQKTYAKMGATQSSSVTNSINTFDNLELRDKLHKSIINLRRLRRSLRQHAAHLFSADFIDISIRWDSSLCKKNFEVFGHLLWSSYDVSRIKTQLVGRAQRKQMLGQKLAFADIEIVARRVDNLMPDKTETTESESGESECEDSESVKSESESENESTAPSEPPDLNAILGSLELTPHEQKLVDCIVDSDKLDMTWDDVIVDMETKEIMQQLVSTSKWEIEATSKLLLREMQIGGALFYGPPGTGKTHLSRAVASCSGSRMIALSPAVLQADLIGESEKVIRAAFSLATKLHPCVLFIDEVDAIFYRRAANDKSWERTFLTQFLQEMDGIDKNENKPLVITATNRPWDLDEAFLRRLPLKVYFGLPDPLCRARMLRLFLKEDDLDPDVDIDGLAEVTARYSGSDLKSLCVYAALAWKVEEARKDSENGDPLFKGTKRLRLRVDHFVNALDKIQPNHTPDLTRSLKEFGKKYNPRVFGSGKTASTRYAQYNKTGRQKRLNVWSQITNTLPLEDISDPELNEPKYQTQLQDWCQLDFREYFAQRLHIYLASLMRVVQAANVQKTENLTPILC